MPKSPLQKLLEEKREEIFALGKKYGVTNIRVFGSVARGEETESSDIDFLVSMQKGQSFFDYIDFRVRLKELLGRDVDVVQDTRVYWFLKPMVMAEARPL